VIADEIEISASRLLACLNTFTVGNVLVSARPRDGQLHCHPVISIIELSRDRIPEVPVKNLVRGGENHAGERIVFKGKARIGVPEGRTLLGVSFHPEVMVSLHRGNERTAKFRILASRHNI
jgi:hypothetical protein